MKQQQQQHQPHKPSISNSAERARQQGAMTKPSQPSSSDRSASGIIKPSSAQQQQQRRSQSQSPARGPTAPSQGGPSQLSKEQQQALKLKQDTARKVFYAQKLPDMDRLWLHQLLINTLQLDIHFGRIAARTGNARHETHDAEVLRSGGWLRRRREDEELGGRRVAERAARRHGRHAELVPAAAVDAAQDDPFGVDRLREVAPARHGRVRLLLRGRGAQRGLERPAALDNEHDRAR